MLAATFPFRALFISALALLALLLAARPSPASGPPEEGLLAHWPLREGAEELVGLAGPARVAGAVDFGGEAGAGFDGLGGGIEVEAGGLAEALDGGALTLSVWIEAPEADGVPGDLLSRTSPEGRAGLLLSLKTSPGVTTSEPNRRHVQFSVDDGSEAPWIDRGRPGEALLAFALAVHEGELYAGTCEPGEGDSGRVYRLEGRDRWIDCGAPDGSNAVTALIVHRGELHAGTGRYRVAGSSLPESPNETPGGRVFRYLGGAEWEPAGELPETEAVGGFGIYQGKLHATSLYHPPGFFRHEGGGEWTRLLVPEALDRAGEEFGPRRVQALAAHRGRLYASSYDLGHVFRWDGETWTDLGRLGENTQTYSFAVHGGRLVAGTWPSGRVYRLEDSGEWTDLGRLGEETEVMGMAVHQGRFVAGTLPLAQVYEYRGGARWDLLERLDHTPDVRYRRAWTMAEHEGGLFCSTLPSGRVFSWSPGLGVAWGRPLPSGWRHLAAVIDERGLELHLDGEAVARRPAAGPVPRPGLGGGVPLRIGSGPNAPFHGRMRDLRIYERALGREEIRALAGPGQKPAGGS